MTRPSRELVTARPLVSAFLVVHLIAIGLGAIPAPRYLPPQTPSSPPDGCAVAGWLAPRLDATVQALSGIPPAVFGATKWLRPAADIYIASTGLGQQWNMFSNPPQIAQYVRVRYYVGAADDITLSPAPSWMATELVLPAHREDETRLLQSYRDSFRDKAVAIALLGFHSNRSQRLIRPNTAASELPKDLAPVARYFSNRFARNRLRDDERIVRTEVWYGTAPIPRPGSTLPNRPARSVLLGEYYDGPIEVRYGVASYPAYHSADEEADITWLLEYFEWR